MSTSEANVTRAKVEAVLFDYGLVLTGPPDPGAWEEMRAILGVEEQAFHTSYWKHRHDYDRATLNSTQYWAAVAHDLGRQMAEPQLSMLLQADTTLWTQPNWPMIEWAGVLQAAGIKTGILSNIGDAMETGVLHTCPWMGGFAHRTFSHRLGVAKPELAIYQHAAAGLNVQANAVLFIDDREDNIQGARAAGMQAVQYRNHVQFVDEFRACGYANELPLPA